jgi:hypothetical protein
VNALDVVEGGPTVSGSCQPSRRVGENRPQLRNRAESLLIDGGVTASRKVSEKWKEIFFPSRKPKFEGRNPYINCS